MLVGEGDIFYIKITFNKEIKLRIMLMINFYVIFCKVFSEIVIVNIVLGTKCMAITNTSVILKPPLPFSLSVRDLESVRRRVGGWVAV